MLSIESVKKYHEQLEKAIADYDSVPIENLHVVISKGNMKIGNVPNVSLPADKTCHHCKDCQRACYDKKACLQYKNVMNARAKNYSILKRAFDKYFSDIWQWLRKSKTEFFRFHVGGDIVSEKYLDSMLDTGRIFKGKHFWTYTKEHDLCNEYMDTHGGADAIPSNFKPMYSRWGYVPINNPYDMPVFWCIVKGQEPPKDMYHCPSNCTICIKKKRGCPYGESAWINEH